RREQTSAAVLDEVVMVAAEDVLDVRGMGKHVVDHRPEADADDVAVFAGAASREAKRVAKEGDRVADEERARGGGRDTRFLHGSSPGVAEVSVVTLLPL